MCLYKRDSRGRLELVLRETGGIVSESRITVAVVSDFNLFIFVRLRPQS